MSNNYEELISRSAALAECLKSEPRESGGVGARHCFQIRDAIRELPTINTPKPEGELPMCLCADHYESHHPDCPVRLHIETLVRERDELLEYKRMYEDLRK